MTTLNAFLTAIADDLKGRLPALRRCRPHAGRFDAAELKRLAARAPGILVAVLGWGQVEEVADGRRDLPLTLAAYIFTRDQKDLAREAAAVNLAEALSLYIPGQRWGTEYAHAAGEVKGQNLYSGKIDRQGVALWAVTWKQTVRLGQDAWAEDGTLPGEVYLGLFPDIGPGHQDDYERVTDE